jgi:hypothetical protein
MKLTEGEYFIILQYLATDIEKNRKLITKIISQMEIPRESKELFWDRFLFIFNKNYKDNKNDRD